LTAKLRVFDYGTITFAPNIGPVHLYERRMVGVGETIDSGAGEIELFLSAKGSR
jgi:hypothetical protein